MMLKAGKPAGRCRRGAIGTLAVVAGVGVLAHPSSGSAAPADVAKCPLKSSATIPAGEAWAFHETGAPSTPHAGITSSYIHGRGDWGGGRGSGTICEEESLASGPSHNIVLTVAGASHLSARVTRLGHLGVVLALRASVAASDDPACLQGTRGTVSVFASYYEGHHDSVQLHFGGGCAGYDATFLGTQLYAVIAENGHQVN